MARNYDYCPSTNAKIARRVWGADQAAPSKGACMTAYVAKDPKGRMRIETVANSRSNCWSAVSRESDDLGPPWKRWYATMRRRGWRVVKVELREVE